MIVTAVCLPSGLKMLVIPIFFPIIPFISLIVYTIGYETEPRHTDRFPRSGIDLQLQSLVCSRPFLFVFLRLPPKSSETQIPEARSTGSKQTLNGLFIFITRVVPKNL
jgi:hypothetical protein